MSAWILQSNPDKYWHVMREIRTSLSLPAPFTGLGTWEVDYEKGHADPFTGVEGDAVLVWKSNGPREKPPEVPPALTIDGTGTRGIYAIATVEQRRVFPTATFQPPGLGIRLEQDQRNLGNLFLWWHCEREDLGVDGQAPSKACEKGYSQQCRRAYCRFVDSPPKDSDPEGNVLVRYTHVL